MMTDTVADMLTCIRNAIAKKHADVSFLDSKFRLELLKVLKQEGYIKDFKQSGEGASRRITVELKYDAELGSVIRGLKRESKAGRRVYFKNARIPKVMSGFGIMVVSTSHGLLSDREARKRKLGGEAVFSVW
jgi:small subunit ribosomal protein S8